MREERRDGERGEGTRGEKMGGGSESVLKQLNLSCFKSKCHWTSSLDPQVKLAVSRQQHRNIGHC